MLMTLSLFTVGCEGTGSNGQICTYTASGTLFCMASNGPNGPSGGGTMSPIGGGQGTGTIGGGSGGTGGTISAADITGHWRMGCIVAAGPAESGAAAYIDDITFFGGSNFNYQRIWYDAANPAFVATACWVNNPVFEVSDGGTYTVGGVVTGSPVSFQLNPPSTQKLIM